MLFVNIKTSHPKKLYINVNTSDYHQQKTTHTFLYRKSKKIAKRLYIYAKSQTLFKKQDNLRYVFIYKKSDTLRYAIFMKMLKLAYINQEHSNLRYVTFLYTKIQTLGKREDNFRYVFNIKIPDSR